MISTKPWWAFKLDELWERRNSPNMVGYYEFEELIKDVIKKEREELIEEIERGIDLAIIGTNPKNNLKAIKIYLDSIKDTDKVEG